MLRQLPLPLFRFLHPSGARRLGPRMALLAGGLLFGTLAGAQTRVSGTVLVAESGAPAHDAEVVLLETNQVVHTDADGHFVFEEVDPLGAFTIHVDLGFLSAVHTVVVDVLEEVAFQIAEPILLQSRHRMHERVTVTASASGSSPFQTFGSVHAMEGLDLQNESARTLAELLESSPGVAIRSFGPGSARPVVRGFDGDRVLIMEDGVRSGDLGSQSADHGVPVDPLQAERIEVVRGPATLLYGSNAIGGAVNVISMGSHLAHSPLPGFRGQANLDYSTADEGIRGGVRAQAAGTGWFVWGGGNSNRTNDYASPAGVVENSAASMHQGEVGFGMFRDRTWFSGSARLDDSRYGVPFAGAFHGAHGPAEEGQHEAEEEGEEHHEEAEGEHDDEAELAVDVAMNRRQFRTDFGIRELDALFKEAEFTVRYSDYDQDEIESLAAGGPEEVATHFDNRSLVLRAELKKLSGRVTSRVGLWGHLREYEAMGEEALAPATEQKALAAFAYNEIQASDQLSLLVGARVERNAYDAGERPEAAEHAHGEEEAEHEEGEEQEEEHEEVGHEEERVLPDVVDRNFLGASASAGARFSLSDSTALVGTASLSSRSPSLEELYNFGPHVGNLAFEIGNPNLDPERSLGFDLSLRQSSERFSGSISAFRYDISDFIFGAAQGEEEGGLPVLEFLQSDATYQGFEVEGHLSIGAAEVVANASYVDAKITGTNEYVPRIPPLGGQLRLDIPVGRLRLAPRVRWAARMDRLYQGETTTDGYAVFDFTASYVFVRHHSTSNISLRAYNITDSEYRHHTSLIKDLAPQMGRGFRISYSLRFF